MTKLKNITRMYSLPTVVLCFVIIFICSSPVYGRPISIYLSGGISDPAGRLGSAMEVGYHGNAKVGFQLEPRTEFLLGVEFHTMPTDHNRLPDVSADFRSIMVGFDIKVNVGIPDDPISPFLIVGGGYANIDFTDTLTQIGTGNSILKANSNSQSYFELGGGFELKQAFALVRFVNIFTEFDDGRFISLGIGYRFSFI